MIQTRKRPPAPHKLAAKQKAWTERFKKGPNTWATKSALTILREGLSPITEGKCAFCEGLLGGTSYLHVEHYHPKKPYEDLAFAWANLFPACQYCNTEKSNEDHRGSLLKPDEDDPEEYLDVDPDTGKVIPAAGLLPSREHRVLETIRILKLNRPQLQTLRQNTIRRLAFWLLAAEKEPIGLDDNEWDAISNPATEFKLVIRTFLRRRGYRPLAEADRSRFHSISPPA